MYLDTNTTNALGDYVAAGPLKLKSGAWNCFARKSGVLTQGGTCENAITNGDTVDLRLKAMQTDMPAHSVRKQPLRADLISN